MNLLCLLWLNIQSKVRSGQYSARHPYVLPAIVALLAIFIFAPDAPAARSRGLAIQPLTPAQMASAGFQPSASCGLFIGIRHFVSAEGEPNPDIAEIPYAVDDAVDLAHLFSMELGLISPDRVSLALSGEPQKDTSRERLKVLLASGARRVSASYTSILSQLDRVGKTSGADGLVVVSFATHGYLLSEQSDQCLFGQDSQMDELRLTGIPVARILDKIGRTVSPRRLVLIDACRERVTQGRAIRDPRAAMSQSFADAMESARGMVILQATTSGGYSYDDPERGNGVFTAEIISGLRGSAPVDTNGFVTIRKLADHLDLSVRDWVTRNKPESARNSGGGISVQIEDQRAADLPLALNAAVGEKARAAAARRERLRGVLKLRMDFRLITTSMVEEIIRFLDAVPPVGGPADAVFERLERLEKEGPGYAEDFAAWWTVNRNRFLDTVTARPPDAVAKPENRVAPMTHDTAPAKVAAPPSVTPPAARRKLCITDVKFIGKKNQGAPQEPGYVVIDQDLNEASGGEFIYLAYKVESVAETDPARTIYTDMTMVRGKDAPAPAGYIKNTYDLNAGTFFGGPIYLCQKPGRPSERADFEKAIVELRVYKGSTQKVEPAFQTICWQGTREAADVNKGAWGQYIYLAFRTGNAQRE